MKQKVVLASGNTGKLREFFEILGSVGFEVVAQSDYDVKDVPETGLTFVENAIIKARNASQQTGLPALADDSGIEVDALKASLVFIPPVTQVRVMRRIIKSFYKR